MTRKNLGDKLSPTGDNPQRATNWSNEALHAGFSDLVDFLETDQKFGILPCTFTAVVYDRVLTPRFLLVPVCFDCEPSSGELS